MLFIFVSVQKSREDSIYQSRESSLYRESSHEREKLSYERGRSKTSCLERPILLERRDNREQREKSVSDEEYYQDFRRKKRRNESIEIRNKEGNFTTKKLNIKKD
jgi:hypothetical protein